MMFLYVFLSAVVQFREMIIGFVTRGRGISIHRTDCVNILSMPEGDRARLIDAEWEEEAVEKVANST